MKLIGSSLARVLDAYYCDFEEDGYRTAASDSMGMNLFSGDLLLYSLR